MAHIVDEPREPMLTALEIARLLRVHINTIKRIPPSDLPFVRVTPRGDRRYDRRDLEAFLASRRTG